MYLTGSKAECSDLCVGGECGGGGGWGGGGGGGGGSSRDPESHCGDLHCGLVSRALEVQGHRDRDRVFTRTTVCSRPGE